MTSEDGIRIAAELPKDLRVILGEYLINRTITTNLLTMAKETQQGTYAVSCESPAVAQASIAVIGRALGADIVATPQQAAKCQTIDIASSF